MLLGSFTARNWLVGWPSLGQLRCKRKRGPGQARKHFPSCWHLTTSHQAKQITWVRPESRVGKNTQTTTEQHHAVTRERRGGDLGTVTPSNTHALNTK